MGPFMQSLKHWLGVSLPISATYYIMRGCSATHVHLRDCSFLCGVWGNEIVGCWLLAV